MAKKIFKTISKVLWGIILGLLTILCVISAWLMVDKYLLRSPVPSFLGYSTLTIETGSMSGTLEIGDLIVIHDAKEYKIGDIVTYLPEGESIPTTHRIINYNEDGTFVTKGDANNVKDSKAVSNDMILGKVVHVFPKVGLFADWVRTEGWLYLVTSLAILGLGLFILKSDDKENQSGKKDSKDDEKSKTTKEIQNTDDSNPILKSIVYQVKKNVGTCFFLLMAVVISIGGTVSYAKYASSQLSNKNSSIATFTCASTIDGVSSLSFTNSTFWMGTGEDKVAMNAVRTMTYTIKNYEEIAGIEKVSSVRMNYVLTLLAPQNFVDKLAIQFFDKDVNPLSPQIVLEDLFATADGGNYYTGDSVEYKGTDAPEWNITIHQNSGTYVAENENMTMTFEPMLVSMNQMIQFRIWDVSSITNSSLPSIDYEGGNLLAPLRVQYHELVPCYKITITCPDFILSAGVAETHKYNLQLTVIDILDDAHLRSEALNESEGLLTSLQVGQTIKLKHPLDDQITSIAIEGMSRDIDGTMYYYSNGEVFSLYDTNNIQKLLLSHVYSKNFPLTMNVIFNQIQ